MERNWAAARHSWARQHAWLLLNFFPFPMGHPEHEHCMEIYSLVVKSEITTKLIFFRDDLGNRLTISFAPRGCSLYRRSVAVGLWLREPSLKFEEQGRGRASHRKTPFSSMGKLSVEWKYVLSPFFLIWQLVEMVISFLLKSKIQETPQCRNWIPDFWQSFWNRNLPDVVCPNLLTWALNLP